MTIIEVRLFRYSHEFNWCIVKPYTYYEWKFHSETRRMSFMRFIEDHCKLFDIQSYGVLYFRVDNKMFEMMNNAVKASARFPTVREIFGKYVSRNYSLQQLHDYVLPYAISKSLSG